MKRVKQTEKKSKFGNLPGPGPGRPKGSVNRTTRLKHAILDGIEIAAKRAGKEGSAEFIAEMMLSDDRVAVLKTGASLIPKEIKQETVERVTITMGPDEDCNGPVYPSRSCPGATADAGQ